MRRLIAKTALRPKRKRSGKTVRPRARPGFNRRRALALAAGLSLALSLVGSAWLWHSGWLGRQADRLANAAYGLTADAGFAVDDVLVEGRRRTDPAAILAALRVARGTPILALDPEAARALIEALPWVRRVTIERRLPSVIYVRLAERQPLAIWQLDGQLSVIDRDGEVIPGVPAKQFAGRRQGQRPPLEPSFAGRNRRTAARGRSRRGLVAAGPARAGARAAGARRGGDRPAAAGAAGGSHGPRRPHREDRVRSGPQYLKDATRRARGRETY
jgi:hypothetical protein